MIGLEAFFAPRIAELATAATEATAVDGFQMLGTMGTRAFLERLYEDDPNGQVANAPQAYDCAVVLSLATAVLDAGDADTLAEAAIDVTDDGVTCTTYDDCLDKLEAGDDINYDGVSGQIALDDNGDPTFARFTSARLEVARSPTSRRRRRHHRAASPVRGVRSRVVEHPDPAGADASSASTTARSTASTAPN